MIQSKQPIGIIPFTGCGCGYTACTSSMPRAAAWYSAAATLCAALDWGAQGLHWPHVTSLLHGLSNDLKQVEGTPGHTEIKTEGIYIAQSGAPATLAVQDHA